jgi:hypothetical protein
LRSELDVDEENDGKASAVDDFVVVKASAFNKPQQFSTSGSQQVQYQSVTNRKFQQTSTSPGIWFGTRGLPGAPRGTPLDSIAENLEVLKAVEA